MAPGEPVWRLTFGSNRTEVEGLMVIEPARWNVAVFLSDDMLTNDHSGSVGAADLMVSEATRTVAVIDVKVLDPLDKVS